MLPCFHVDWKKKPIQARILEAESAAFTGRKGRCRKTAPVTEDFVKSWHAVLSIHHAFDCTFLQGEGIFFFKPAEWAEKLRRQWKPSGHHIIILASSSTSVCLGKGRGEVSWPSTEITIARSLRTVGPQHGISSFSCSGSAVLDFYLNVCIVCLILLVSMYICVYVYMCIRVYLCMCIFVYVLRICMSVYFCISVYMCMRAFVLVFMFMDLCLYIIVYFL